MKAEEILRKHIEEGCVVDGGIFTDEDWNDEDFQFTKEYFLKAMKEYAEYIAKCAHRDMRHKLTEDYLDITKLHENFHSTIMNHQFVAPKELL
jgi:sulfur relay (sulfurtransferase) DsrC/TusE family protein